jgi:hypothetical protein
MRSRARLVAGALGLIALVIAAPPAGAVVSYGTAQGASYTVALSSGLGSGSCVVSYELGPYPTVAVPPINDGGIANASVSVPTAGLGVESALSVGDCTGASPEDLYVSTSASGPGGLTGCSNSADYFSGFSSGPPGASTSCSMTSITGRYSASDSIELDPVPDFSLHMTNSVPGCTNNSGGYITCKWHPSYDNTDF